MLQKSKHRYYWHDSESRSKEHADYVEMHYPLKAHFGTAPLYSGIRDEQ